MDIRTFLWHYFDQNHFPTQRLYSWVFFTTLNNTNNNTNSSERPQGEKESIWLHLFCILEMLAHSARWEILKFPHVPLGIASRRLLSPALPCSRHIFRLNVGPWKDNISGELLCESPRIHLLYKNSPKATAVAPADPLQLSPNRKKEQEERRENSETITWVTICVKCLLDLQLLSLPAMFSLERNDLKKRRQERLRTGRLNEAPLLFFPFTSSLYVLQVFASFPMFCFVSVWKKVARLRHSLSPMTVI